MQIDIIKRVHAVGDYILENHATVRQTAIVFGISKSTVHNDIAKRLKILDTVKYESVQAILDYNFSIRHIRGGESTKNKYINSNKNNKFKKRKF